MNKDKNSFAEYLVKENHPESTSTAFLSSGVALSSASVVGSLSVGWVPVTVVSAAAVSGMSIGWVVERRKDHKRRNALLPLAQTVIDRKACVKQKGREVVQAGATELWRDRKARKVGPNVQKLWG